MAAVVAERDGLVATLWIDNVGQRNALTPAMLEELPVALRELAGDGGTRVVLLRGREGVFSSGYAIDQITEGSALPRHDLLSAAADAIEGSPLVVLGVLEGFAVGGALELACACDFRLAEAGTRLGITPAKLGLVYSWTGMARVARVVGLPATRDLFLTARLVDAGEAHAMGLVSAVHEGTAALEAAVAELCGRLAAQAPLSLAGSKRVLAELARAQQLPPDVAEELHELRVRAMDSPDHAEAKAALRERRPPTFTGQEPR